jgi:hypothetical protein
MTRCVKQLDNVRPYTVFAHADAKVRPSLHVLCDVDTSDGSLVESCSKLVDRNPYDEADTSWIFNMAGLTEKINTSLREAVEHVTTTRVLFLSRCDFATWLKTPRNTTPAVDIVELLFTTLAVSILAEHAHAWIENAKCLLDEKTEVAYGFQTVAGDRQATEYQDVCSRLCRLQRDVVEYDVCSSIHEVARSITRGDVSRLLSLAVDGSLLLDIGKESI